MRRFSKITTTQLARICGVSQGTVDRALHNRPGISEKTREHILSVAREYDYVPRVKGAETGNSMLIGVVLFDLNNEYFSKLAMSLVTQAKRAGYSLIFQFSEKDLAGERKALEYFDYIGVDGIVLFSVGSSDKDYENYLKQIHKPLVLIGNRMCNLPYIGIDDRLAMRDVSLCLAEEAPEGEIVYFAPILRRPLHENNAQRLRFQGFSEAMETLGRNFCTVTDIRELGDAKTVVCATDYYAVTALKYLGFPGDIRISGFDNISLLKYIPVSVLTVEYSTDRIARECVNYLLGKPYHPKIGYQLTSAGIMSNSSKISSLDLSLE